MDVLIEADTIRSPELRRGGELLSEFTYSL